MRRWRSTACNDLITLTKFDALLFDMDGLLLDSEREFMTSLVELGRPLGFSKDALEGFFRRIVGTSAAVTSDALAAFLPDHVDPAAFEKDWRATNARRRQGHIPLRPDVDLVIPSLAAAGYRMAVVTSTKRAPALQHLDHAGLLEHFELLVGGDEVAANKPDPAPYLQAARALGVNPTSCAAFEDSDLGTQAAVSAGCTTTQIPDLRPSVPLPQLGQRVANSLGQAVRELGLLPMHVA